MGVKNPIFTISASLLNNIIWYKSQKTKARKAQALQQLKDALNRVFIPNEHTERGNRFEEECYEGKHPQFKVDYTDMQVQKWFNKYIHFADFTIKVVGKVDAYDEVNKTIYDIKRPIRWDEYKYTDLTTTQHDIYLYLIPEANSFEYLVAYNLDGTELSPIEYTKVKYGRKDNLDEYVLNKIIEFIQVLDKEGLLETYLENFEVDF